MFLCFHTKEKRMYIINTNAENYTKEQYPNHSAVQLNLFDCYKIFNDANSLEKFNSWLDNHKNVQYIVLNDKDVNIDKGIRDFIQKNRTIKFLGINIDDYNDFTNLTQIVTQNNFNIEKLMFHKDIAIPHYYYNALERADVQVGWLF